MVGLGKIGLPLAAHFASKGHAVIGADINSQTVNLVNQGVAPFSGEQGLDVLISTSVATGNLRATTSTQEAVAQANVVVVAVPVFINDSAQPVLGAMEEATREIGKGLMRGTLVAFETTLPVGTTRKKLTPILEETSGLVAGQDFFVVFSPERVLTGRIFADLRKYPKLVGGIDAVSELRGVEFYETVLDFDNRKDLSRANGVWSLGTAEAAELAKLAETTYRDVNIALANQFAVYAETLGVNIYEVIEACNSQNFSHIHQPGVAVGGHCIPVYPHLYLAGDPGASVVSASRAANKSMPGHIVEKIESSLGTLKDKIVAILGLSYRGGVKESAFSGTWDLIELISSKGGKAVVHDPLYSVEELESLLLTPYKLGEKADAAVLQANHQQYLGLKPEDLPGVSFIADGRNFVPSQVKLKIDTYVLGVGTQKNS